MDPSKLRTDELAHYIDQRYADRACQGELDMLESLFATRVTEEDTLMSEDDLSITEMELNVGEENAGWVSLEGQLMDMYHRFITPDERCAMEVKDIIDNMRDAIDCYPGSPRNAGDFEDAVILAAGRDAYDRRISLLRRLRQTSRRFRC